MVLLKSLFRWLLRLFRTLLGRWGLQTGRGPTEPSAFDCPAFQRMDRPFVGLEQLEPRILLSSAPVTVGPDPEEKDDAQPGPFAAEVVEPTNAANGAAQIEARHVFYNNSSFDGEDAGPGGHNDEAIAPDKQPLLPGETASFANYTSYSRGLNGILVDIRALAEPSEVSADDFEFLVGNNSDPASWDQAPDPIHVHVREGDGIDGSDRVELIWDDNAIEKTWLQVTALANDVTGLAEDEVFYFGNAIGETGQVPGSARVDLGDVIRIRENQTGSDEAPIDDPYDINREGQVAPSDVIQARHNQSGFNPLELIAVPTDEPVVLEAALANDTGTGEGVTSDPAIAGQLEPVIEGAEVSLGFNEAPLESFVEITEHFEDDGHVELDRAQLESLHEAPLDDGQWQVHLRAMDAAGAVVASEDVVFTLDTTPPESPSFALESRFAVAEDQTTHRSVALVGESEPEMLVRLVDAQQQRMTAADGDGQFRLSSVLLDTGSNTLSLAAEDLAGNLSEATAHTLERVMPEGEAEAALTWNNAALEAIRRDGTDPAMASRSLAMVTAASYDAINAVDGASGSFYVRVEPRTGASAEAAAATAAHGVLEYLYTDQAAHFDELLRASLESIDPGEAKDDGIAVGEAVAERLIDLRRHDGARDFVSHTPGSGVGDWRPTLPGHQTAQHPQWPDVIPFAMDSGDQFRPVGPPEVGSDQYMAEFEEVMALGGADSDMRTEEQTQMAWFWRDGVGTYTPAGHWNQIASDIAEQEELTLFETSRLLAQLNVAMADAAIAAWDAKYTYDQWRPITAIRHDNGEYIAFGTEQAQWRSLLPAPPFPDYISGHATYSGAAERILADHFGEQYEFSSTQFTGPDEPEGPQREFASFTEAAEEAAASRLYGGIHFRSSNDDGLATGRKVGDHVLAAFDDTADTTPPVINVLDPDPDSAFNEPFTLRGTVVDGLSEVESLEARLNDGDLFEVDFDGDGRFELTVDPAADGLDDGEHTIHLRATDAPGNTSEFLAHAFTLVTQPPQLEITAPEAGANLDSGARLTGTVSTGGSQITAMHYQINDDEPRPLVFNHASGQFDHELALGHLDAGEHTLTVTAGDDAGHQTASMLEFQIEQAAPPAIVDVAPRDGASSISVKRQPRIEFSRPIDPETLSDENLYLSASGDQLPTNHVLSSDGTTAWLFPTQPLPGSTLVRVNVDGEGIQDLNGDVLDADASGEPGGMFTSSFTTVDTSALPTTSSGDIDGTQSATTQTSLVGVVADPGPDLIPGTPDDVRPGDDGVLMTGEDEYLRPLEGVEVWILGREDEKQVTGEDGRFEFEEVPPGQVKLVIDGHTATNTPEGVYFPELTFDVHIQPGEVNTVFDGQQPQRQPTGVEGVYLARLQESALSDVDNDNGTSVSAAPEATPELTPEQRAAFSVDLPAGEVVDSSGEPIENPQLGLTTVPSELVTEMLPLGEDHLREGFVFSVQTPGAYRYASDAQVTLPNTLGAAPGTQVNLLSGDHTEGRLEREGTAVVSADGSRIVSNPGDGLTQPGWHVVEPPHAEFELEVFDESLDREPGWAEEFSAGLRESFDAAAGIAGLIGFSRISIAASAINFVENPSVQTFVPLAISAAGFYPPLALPATMAGTILGSISTAQSAENAIGHFNNGFSQLVNPSMTPALLNEADNRIRPMLSASSGDPIAELQAAKEAFDAAADRALDEFEHQHPLWHRVRDNAEALEPLFANVDPNEEIRFGLTESEWAELKERFIEFVQDVQAIQERPLITNLFQEMLDAAIEVRRLALQHDFGTNTPVDATTEGERSNPPTGDQWFVALESQEGEVQRFTIDAFQALSRTVRPDTYYRLEIYDPHNDRIGHTVFKSGSAGGVSALPSFKLVPDTGTDTAGNGLSDSAEHIIGTDPEKWSTAGDGISDYAKIQQGINPLGDHVLPTGVVSQLELPGPAREVAVVGDLQDGEGQTAYVATGSHGLAVVDATRFQRPVVLGQLALPGEATDVAVDPVLERAVVTTGIGGVHVIDMADPAAPVLERTIDVNASRVEVFEGVAYTPVSDTLRAYDVLTGERLQSLLPTGADRLEGVAREGETLYTLDATGLLHAIEIDGLLMHTRDSIDTAAARGTGHFVGNGLAYVPQGNTDPTNGGFEVFDVSDPDHLVRLGDVDDNAIAGQAIAANGSGRAITVADRISVGDAFESVVDVVDVSDPERTDAFLTRFTVPAAEGVAIAAGIGFVAGGADGLTVINYMPFDGEGQAPQIDLDVTDLDTDPDADGIQVIEGSTIRPTATVRDDVQVRNVEILLDGEVVRNEVSFPFDLSAAVPRLPEGEETMTVELQVRATDTGGNVATSDVVALELVPDTVPPQIAVTTPEDDGRVGQHFQSVVVTFDKPMDPASLSADNFTLMDPDGSTLTPEHVQVRRLDSQVQLTYADEHQPLGEWEMVVHAADITDRSGNALGDEDLTIGFTVREATAVWINPDGGDWSTAANWDTGEVPDARDDVLIDASEGAVITYDLEDAEVRSLRSHNPLVLDEGTLTVAQTFEAHETVTLEGGRLREATLTSGGDNGKIVASGFTQALENVTLGADLVIEDSSEVAVHGDLRLAHGAQVRLMSDGGVTDLTFRDNGAQHLGGEGEVIFDGETDQDNHNRLWVREDRTHLTIGPEVTVRTGSTGGAIEGRFQSDEPRLTLQGTISARTEGRTLTLGEDLASFTNEGTLHVAEGVLALAGEFTTADLGAFDRAGGTVALTGTLDNRDRTLDVQARFQDDLTLDGGWLRGGTVTSSGTAELVIGDSDATLEAITLETDVSIGDGRRTEVRSGLTLDEEARVSIESTGSGTELIFLGADAQTLDGNGEIVFNGDHSPSLDSRNVLGLRDDETVLTIGPEITVSTGTSGGYVGGHGLSDERHVINQGTITARTESRTLAVGERLVGLTNEGTVKAVDGGDLEIHNLAEQTGVILSGSGSRVTAEDSFENAEVGEVHLEISGSDTEDLGRVEVSGVATLAGTLHLHWLDDFVPSEGDTFEIMTFESRTGEFDTLVTTGLEETVELELIYEGSALLVQRVANANDGASAMPSSLTTEAPASDFTERADEPASAALVATHGAEREGLGDVDLAPRSDPAHFDALAALERAMPPGAFDRTGINWQNGRPGISNSHDSLGARPFGLAMSESGLHDGFAAFLNDEKDDEDHPWWSPGAMDESVVRIL